jgi:PAS domain S-box-containing protein
VRLSVTTKIFLSLTGVLAMFGTVAIYSILTLKSIGGQLEVVDEGYIPLTRIAAELEALESKTSLDLDELQSLRDPQGGVRLLRQLYPTSIAARVSGLLARAQQIVDTALGRKYPPSDAAFFERVRGQLTLVKRQHRQNVADLSTLLSVVGSGRRSAVLSVRERLRVGEGFIRTAVRGLVTELEARITATVLGVRREERTSAWAVMALAVVAAAVGLFLVLYAQYKLRPIKGLTEGVARIARGDYSSRVEIAATDEIGTLATEFNRMAASLLEREQRLVEKQRELEAAYRALEAQKRFSENIVESIRSAVVVADREGRVSALNRAALETLGLRAGDDLAGAAPLCAVPDLAARLQAALEGAESNLEAVALPDGRSFDLKLAPFRDAEGTAQGALLIVDDVTERVRTKEQLVKSERLAAVGRIAAQITHEIRNPLSSIGLNAELLGEEVARFGEGEKAKEARGLVRSIAREVDRLTEVTEQYLRYARLPAPRFAREEVNAILADLLNFMDGELRARGISVRRDLADALPAVEADENQLRQAFLNVLRNSCESMRSGGQLRVETSSCDGIVRLTIADTGVGIEKKNLERIFDPFFSTKEGGTGLGLALTHQIIEEHGGTITCESEVGRGTTFTISLPAAPGR